MASRDHPEFRDRQSACGLRWLPVVASLASAAVARVGSPAGSLLPTASATPTAPPGLFTLGHGAHTPRRTALKWEPLRTVRAEPLALSKKTEVYCPACREAPRSARTLWTAGTPTARPALPAQMPHRQTQHLRPLFSRFLPSSISLLHWRAPLARACGGKPPVGARVKLSLQNSGERVPLPPRAWPLTPLVEPS